MKRGRSVLLGGILVVLFLTLATRNTEMGTSNQGPRAPRPSDPYDPNETFSTAKVITAGWKNNLTTNITDIYDYFRISMSANYRLTVKINWSIALDLDLYLLDSDQDELVSSHEDRTHLNETVNYEVRTAGNYYIKVYYWDWDHTGSEPAYVGITINYSLYVDNSVAISPIDSSSEIFIIILVVAAFGTICPVAVAVNRKKQQALTRPPTVPPVRSQVEAPFPPKSSYPPKPTSYEPSIPPKPLVKTESPQPGLTRRFCFACGAPLEATQRFCHNCGMDMEASH